MALSRETYESVAHDAYVESKEWRTVWALIGDSAVFIDVPYKEKDQAKQAGARWDPTAKKWYVDNWQACMYCWHWVPQEFKDRVRTKRESMRK